MRIQQIQELARIFKALSDPNRLAILQLLRERCGNGCRVSEEEERNTVSEIAEEFHLSLSTVSHHLKELRIAGLIDCRKRGQSVFCTPNDEIMRSIREFIER